ncbi:hypothetical protein OH76DRAFT_1423603 [Lentinus brumalis]|uniref:Aminoacyl-tRNA synthetase class Ia domain-containing protein n=1 Tax=Lentinus brumalis TaxID=2498619 RepID=A0A371CK03_9APHY|nr:hypothetical protein OH76DRAFT_1423603 [Polyporus brumalis]
MVSALCSLLARDCPLLYNALLDGSLPGLLVRKLDNLKDNAIAALQDVQFVPAISHSSLESFIRSHSEWCISRQRVTGIPIPALYHVPSNTAVLDSDSLEHTLSVLREHGPRHWWEGPSPLSFHHRGTMTETMAVWFDSGTTWSRLDDLYASLGGASQDGKDVRRTFDPDVCLKGTDQGPAPRVVPEPAAHGARERDTVGAKAHRTVLNAHHARDEDVQVAREHHFPNDSHSRGQRLWVATVEFGKDMTIGSTVLQQCAETMRKIRNSSRFILGSLSPAHHPSRSGSTSCKLDGSQPGPPGITSNQMQGRNSYMAKGYHIRKVLSA